MQYLLLSHQLNTMYVDDDATSVVVMVAHEQFKLFDYHTHRIVYHISAAKHFALEHGYQYVETETYLEGLHTLQKKSGIVLYQPIDFAHLELLNRALDSIKIKVIKRIDRNFMIPDITKELGSPPFKMDSFYRRWRHRFNCLLDDGKPIGGQYSHDVKNRSKPPRDLTIEPPLFVEADDITKQVIDEVRKRYSTHPTSTKPFNYPVTRKDALALLQHFLDNRLEHFGRYQDAMMSEYPFMVHSMVSASINLGLLRADEVIHDIEQAYYDNLAPIEAVEGFIRQVLGWREYIRGVYLVMGPSYADNNHLQNALPLPDYMYNGEVDMNCLRTTVQETIDHAYNHHIQRLMVIGNISNLIGIDPSQIRKWFNEMYVDSFDWVVTPNVIGMAMYADGGQMSTKPYISSANYINTMSDYCTTCMYNHKERIGDHACPINALYYTFLDKHKDILSNNPRMGYTYANLERLDRELLAQLKAQVKTWSDNIFHP